MIPRRRRKTANSLNGCLAALAFILCTPLPCRCQDRIPDAIDHPAPPVRSSGSPASVKEIVGTHIKAGRELFQKKKYTEALAEFNSGLALEPGSTELRYHAALAAYWAKQFAASLELWNGLLDAAKRNTANEWEIQKNRVMVLSAMNQADAAGLVVERLYELHREKKLPAAINASGFVREHFFINDLRIGCWETLDDRNEVQELWSFPVVNSTDTMVKRLSVELALLPGGGPGVVLAEEIPGIRRIYKRWVQRPEYDEVRALVLQVLKNESKPIQESIIDNSKMFLPEVQTPVSAQPQKPIDVSERQKNPNDEQTQRDVAALGLDPTVSRLITLAAHLRSVNLDITRLTCLSLTDQGLADRYLKEQTASAPSVQDDASDLVDQFAKSNNAQVNHFFGALGKLGTSSAYLDFVILTAINTRPAATLPPFVETCLKSGDFMVRQTAATLLARRGDRHGLELLFGEVEGASPAECSILQIALEELLGQVLGSPPSPGAKNEAKFEEAVKLWKANTSSWWKENNKKLHHVLNSRRGEPEWKTNSSDN